MNDYRVLDIFSGIGGFSLGLERAGMRTVAFCEIEPYCRAVLRKHWSDVPCYDDVRTLTAERLRADGIVPNVICGGFPCQDISNAGKRTGIGGKRSGLWSEYARIIGEIRPDFAIVENVAALLNRGLDVVLGDLAALGYDAEWHCIPASAVSAPHRRDRIWIVAHPASNNGGSGRAGRSVAGGSRQPEPERTFQDVAYPARVQPRRQEQRPIGERVGKGGQPEPVANADKPRLEGWLRRELSKCAGQFAAGPGDSLANPSQSERRAEEPQDLAPAGQRAAELGERSSEARPGSDWWLVEPNVGRVAHGIPSRVDRLRALGNAVVPQIPEMIGRAIMEATC